MKTKYHIVVNQGFFDTWEADFKQWKQTVKHTEDTKFIMNLIEHFLQEIVIDKVVVSKYTDFEEEVYLRYITHIKNQIYKILPLAEERGEWRKHLDTLIVELTGADKVFLRTVNFISLINKLETLKKLPEYPNSLSLAEIKATSEFKTFRKTIFECMNIANMLSVVKNDANKPIL